MVDAVEKAYTDWSIDVGDYKYEGITLNEVDQEQDFVVISPSNAIPIDNKMYNFVQVCSDQDTDLLHIELSVTNDGEQGAIIYGKNELGHQETFQIIEEFIAHHKAPSLDDWEVVLDLRPKMESYVKGTNDD